MTSLCPICESTTPILLDKCFSAPLLQNRVWPDPVSARAAPVGELDFVLCAACGFAWNRAFRPDQVIYDQAYDSDQMGSPQFRAHVAAMIERMLTCVPSGRLTHLVEVGCGQGDFLTELARRKCFASLTGFDPAWRGKEGLEMDGITIHRQYFRSGALDRVPHGPLFVVSRLTIEHVADPLSFLRAIRATMKPNDDERLFLETADIEWIIETFQPQDLFYEHCSIFSRDALRVALAATSSCSVGTTTSFSAAHRPRDSGPDAVVRDQLSRPARQRDVLLGPEKCLRTRISSTARPAGRRAWRP